ncbi:MAG TPA: DUF58 domain-containing protein [Chloroflexota bacterium]|nr:DUF58 domain-containing protein [Chloroflexota bacterium]
MWPFRRRRVQEEHAPLSAPGEAERLLKRLDFTVIRRLDGLRQGEHRNLAYGFGLDLAELREYQPGDDVRALDWNVTARMDRPFVRSYHEDREVTAWMVLDLTASTDFGSGTHTKREVLIDAAGTLARLLTADGDRVGALLYAGSQQMTRRRRPPARTRSVFGNAWLGGLTEVEKLPAEVVRAGTGRLHVLHLLQRTMAAVTRVPAAGAYRAPRDEWGRDRPPISDLAALLEQAFRTARGRSLVLVLSDFLAHDGNDDGWMKAFAPLARRHEVVGVWLRDPREVELPRVGVVTLQDAESGEQVVVDTSQPSLRAAYAALAAERQRRIEHLFALHGAALWTLSTADAFVPALVTFLEQRRRTLVGARRLLAAAG